MNDCVHDWTSGDHERYRVCVFWEVYSKAAMFVGHSASGSTVLPRPPPRTRPWAFWMFGVKLLAKAGVKHVVW